MRKKRAMIAKTYQREIKKFSTSTKVLLIDDRKIWIFGEKTIEFEGPEDSILRFPPKEK